CDQRHKHLMQKQYTINILRFKSHIAVDTQKKGYFPVTVIPRFCYAFSHNKPVFRSLNFITFFISAGLPGTENMLPLLRPFERQGNSF
ncbi:TPA: hypothetical protein ACG7E9_005073, partial [Escherichia coli]